MAGLPTPPARRPAPGDLRERHSLPIPANLSLRWQVLILCRLLVEIIEFAVELLSLLYLTQQGILDPLLQVSHARFKERLGRVD